jgi:hypothetical protein
MGIQIKFERVSDKIAKYFVSIGGFAAVCVGEGAQGRSNALGLLSYVGLAKEAKDIWIRGLDQLAASCVAEAVLTVKKVGETINLTAIRDNSVVFDGDDVEEFVTAFTSRTAETNSGLRGPGG